MSRKRALVYHPNAGLRYFSESIVFFVNKLKAQGYEVNLLACESDYSEHCNVHAARNLSQFGDQDKKRTACTDCLSERKKFQPIFSKTWTLSSLLNQDDHLEIANRLSDFRGFAIDQIEVDQFQIGRYAAYEFILNNKIANINEISAELLEIYFKIYLKNCLITWKAVKKLLAQQDYECAFVYNSSYGSEHLVRSMFEKLNKDNFFIHGGRNLEWMYSSFYFSRLSTGSWNLSTIGHFRDHYESLELDYQNFAKVIDHFRALYASKSIHTYSAATDNAFYESELWKRVKTAKKVILLSLSSGDEFYAADYSVDINNYINKSRSLFESRFAWLKSIRAYFEKRTDCLVILRFHPREFPNKREGFLSKEVKKLEAALENLPDHFYLNYPDQKLSIYNILQFTDLHLCSQSSVGFESSALGVPTVCYIDGIGNYPISRVSIYEPTVESYFGRLEQELNETPRTEFRSIKMAFEWIIYLHLYAIYNFDSHGLLNPTNLHHRIVKKIVRTILPYNYQKLFFSLKPSEEAKFNDFILHKKEMYLHTKSPKATISKEGNHKYFLNYLFELRKLIRSLNQGNEQSAPHNRVFRNLDSAIEHFKKIENF
jgi:hypothetical protein